MLGVGVGLGNVFTLDVNALVIAAHRFVHHVGDAKTDFRVQGYAPVILKRLADLVVADRTIAWQFMWERAHIARALNIVLPSKWVNTNPHTANVAGGHSQVRHANNHGRALRMFGNAKAIINTGIPFRGIEAGGGHNILRQNAGYPGDLPGRVFGPRGKCLPFFECVFLTARINIFLVNQAFGHDHMRKSIDHGNIRAGLKRQVVVGLNMRGRAHQLYFAGVEDDQLGAIAQPPFHAAGKNRVRIGRIGADYHDDVTICNAFKILGACRRTKRFA